MAFEYTLANSADSDEMQHNAAIHLGLHCLLIELNPPSGTEIYHNLENTTHVPFKYKVGNPILIVSLCIIRIQKDR